MRKGLPQKRQSLFMPKMKACGVNEGRTPSKNTSPPFRFTSVPFARTSFAINAFAPSPRRNS